MDGVCAVVLKINQFLQKPFPRRIKGLGLMAHTRVRSTGNRVAIVTSDAGDQLHDAPSNSLSAFRRNSVHRQGSHILLDSGLRSDIQPDPTQDGSMPGIESLNFRLTPRKQRVASPDGNPSGTGSIARTSSSEPSLETTSPHRGILSWLSTSKQEGP